MPQRKDYGIEIGDVFGRLTFNGEIKTGGQVGALYGCSCACGKVIFVRGSDLVTGRRTSCGCGLAINAIANGYKHSTHNDTGSPEFNAWNSMIQRCTNPNYIGYHNYGERGITVCDEWLNDYPAFLAHVGRKPSPKHSLDRFPNNDGNYEPGNVRWATPKQQHNNKRINRRLLIDGVDRTLTEWSDSSGVKLSTLRGRLASTNWTLRQAVGIDPSP